MASDFKLPQHIRPVNYDLTFDVDLKNFKFSGEETIDLEIRKPSSEIVMNAADLDIKTASLVSKKETLDAKVKTNPEKETVSLKFGKKVSGPAKLIIEFAGKLTDSLLGFYRSKYTDSKGSDKYIATTQFEAPYARRAFPCFDEPEYKTTFDVTLVIDRNLDAVSNMPVKEELKHGDRKTVRFQRSPKMSTYLLYLGVGDFEFLEDNLGKTLVRLVTVPGKKSQASFALDLAKKFLSYFQDYSNVPYPLPKLDLIALPDFIVGAMENWGAITFREIYLLFDPKVTSTAVKKRIAMIIAHELWHQWSGNLVTMKWWNDLWLNESFATFMAYKAVDHYFPEWKMWEDFISDETERALEDDSLKATHPIEVHVENPHQIEELFDAISYSKGGSILRMIEGYLGDDLFRRGIGNYLSSFKYGNATSDDLWNSLEKVSKKPMRRIASSWIRQPGYPLVRYGNENGNTIAEQKRFVFGGNNDAIWPVPLVVKAGENISTIVLDKRKIEIPLGGYEWFKMNYGQTGFYRVKYPEDVLTKLRFMVSGKMLPPLDRWGMQNDVFELCVNGELKIDSYLNFVRAYYSEDSYLVLSNIYQQFRYMHSVYSQEAFWESIWPKFREYHMEPFGRILDRLGWEPKKDEPQEESLLRELSLKYLAFIEDQDVLKKGIGLFDGYAKGRYIHPDIKAPVFYMSAANGDDKTYKTLVELYSKTQTPEEKRLILIALGQFKRSEMLEKALDFSLSPKVRVQDLSIIISAIASNPMSRDILLPWFRKNWKRFKKFEKSGQLFIRIIEALIGAYADRKSEKELREFFKSHPVKYKMTLERAFERLTRTVSWRENNREMLAKYFG